MKNMTWDDFVRELTGIVGDGQVATSPVGTELYAYDASLARGQASVVVFPGDTHETARVIRAANRAGIPFVPRGFGTNLSGGTVLLNGGMVICLARMNRILGIYPERRCAVVQPGVTNLELQNALLTQGFFFAPDPASQKVATLGGNVGENSGGPHCLKYGVTTNHILGLEMVTAQGEIHRIGNLALDPPGYDLRGVIIGSEGTFGVVTEITARILPKPETVITMLAIYTDIADAAASVSDIIAAGIVPATLEMMDAPIMAAVEASYACGYPRDAAAVLIIEVEGPVAGLTDQARHIQAICKNNNCREIEEAKDGSQRNRLWEGRRGAFGAVARLAPNYLVNDCTVPRTRLPDALVQVSKIVEKYGLQHGNVFHAGDGNLHPLILFDARDPDQLRRVKAAGHEIMQACVDLGGTISGEHGVGVEKIDAMRLVFSEADMAVQRAVHRAFDPDEQLNPGKVVPQPERRTHDGIPTKQITPLEEETAIADAIIRAAAARQPVIPLGNGCFPAFGNFSEKDVTGIVSRDLAHVLDLDSANQVVTVGAGMTLATLQSNLKDHGQWLPVRPPFNQDAVTLGALTALGVSGPERMAYGGIRDLLLGLRFVDAKGRVISAGGKVVKNVAGYDMTRLLTGSAGTLGFITQVTCRVQMMPEQCMALTAEGAFTDCEAAAFDFLTSALEPVFIVVLPVEDAWQIRVGFEGFAKTVSYQIEKAGETLTKYRLDRVRGVAYAVYTGMMSAEFESIYESPFVLRGSLAPDEIGALATALTGSLDAGALVVDFGSGRLWAGASQMTGPAWEKIGRSWCGPRGHVLLEKAPESFKKDHDVFGPARPEWSLIYKIKEALDPVRLFAPGRLPGKK